MTKKIKDLLYLILPGLLLCTQAQAQVKVIRFKKQRTVSALKHYHITGIQDDRKDTATIGTLRIGLGNRITPANLENGAVQAIQQYINHSIMQPVEGLPVVLHIEQLEVAEKKLALREQIDVNTVFAFYNGDTRLIAYTGSAYAQTGVDATMYAEQLIRQELEKALNEFDGWIGRNAVAAIPANTSVQVKIRMDTVSSDPDEIAFRKAYHLQYADFQAEPDDLSSAAAATYSGIHIGYSSATLNNKVDLLVSIGAIFNKKQSWCRHAFRTPATLQHEQCHFNITAIQACQLIRKVEQFSFTAGYAQELLALQKQQQQELDMMQRQYDKETNHGRIAAVQQEWEQRIRSLLASCGCY